MYNVNLLFWDSGATVVELRCYNTGPQDGVPAGVCEMQREYGR